VRTPHHEQPEDGYARPQQAWQCGLSDEAPPCTLGPLAGGRCPGSAACYPRRDGDRWHCNRSHLRGGPCDAGPGPDGTCGVTHHCTPRRSLRGRRGRFVVGCLIAAVGAACLGLGGFWRRDVLAPGPLSIHHAHLLAGQDQTQRCALCHQAADASLPDWVSLGGTSAAAARRTTQSALCMKCHDKTLPVEFATAAHNMPLDALRALSASTEASSHALRDATEAIACAACHREHHGRDHDLAQMTDQACQACHREQFDSFAHGHPDFGTWPYVRRTRIAFDHALHEAKHHPAEKRTFACADCHVGDATGSWQVTRSYAESCAACHDKPLAISLADGVPLVALPTLDLATLEDAGHKVGVWPADADGDFDGALPLTAKVLLAAKPEAAAAMATLGPTFDYYDIDPDNSEQTAAAAVIAAELRALVEDLATRGQPAIVERLVTVLGREPTAAQVEALAGRLSPDVVAQYRQRWFRGSATAPSETEGDRAAQLAQVPGGGWIRDDATLSLRYRATGHADPWLRAWLDVMAAGATGPRAEIAEPLLRAALKPTAAGQCGSCHSVERDAAGQLAIQWQPRPPGATYAGLTHFSHASHVVQSQLRDCQACHEIAPHESAPYAGDDPRQFVADFTPLTKASCVTCHTSTAAGDACTQCHRYHGGQ
jgi:hypothetical protein